MAMEAAGYQPRRARRAPGDALADRLGPRQLVEGDARYKVDKIYQSELIKEEAPQGPACFAFPNQERASSPKLPAPERFQDL